MVFFIHESLSVDVGRLGVSCHLRTKGVMCGGVLISPKGSTCVEHFSGRYATMQFGDSRLSGCSAAQVGR